MKINKELNTTILCDNNLNVLSLFPNEIIIDDLNKIKNIKDSFVIFNDVLRNLKEKDFLYYIDYLNKNNIHFINITSKIEEVLYSDYLVIYHNNRIIIEGNTLGVLKEEKILKRMGYNLPFIVDLSLQLSHYDLIDSMYLDDQKLVDTLW